MRHAYLIMVHHEFEILQHLLTALDDERNDLYIHVDKQVDTLPILHTKKAGLVVLENRIRVYWGDVSQVAAELRLFDAASKNGPYTYHHVLSGVDMPLKSQDYIHNFFALHQGKEFIGFTQGNLAEQIDRKVRRYHLFPRHFRAKQRPLDVSRAFLRALCLRLQYLSGYRRHTKMTFKKGTSWVSVTSHFVDLLLACKTEIMQLYQNSFCADEIFIHTFCWTSVFRERLFDPADEGHGCMRLVQWRNGQIVDWENKDYELLMNSDALFARKFNSGNMEVVDRILKAVRI